jgi:hypothetical protein
LSGSRWWFLSRKPAVLPTRTNKHGVFEPKKQAIQWNTWSFNTDISRHGPTF